MVGEARAAVAAARSASVTPGVPDGRVQLDPEREVVRQTVVHGDDTAPGFVDSDEVHLARREPEGGQQADEAAEDEDPARCDETPAPLARPVSRGGAWPPPRSAAHAGARPRARRCPLARYSAWAVRRASRPRSGARRVRACGPAGGSRPGAARHRLAGERVVLRRVEVGDVRAPRAVSALRRGRGRAPRPPRAEQDHRDVVAPAGVVGGGDQRAPELLQRPLLPTISGLRLGSRTIESGRPSRP